MLTATLWPGFPTPSHNKQPLHSLKNRWYQSLQTCKKLSCSPDYYFPHMNVFPGASGKRSKRGNVHVSPETESLILHPHTWLSILLTSVKSFLIYVNFRKIRERLVGIIALQIPTQECLWYCHHKKQSVCHLRPSSVFFFTQMLKVPILILKYVSIYIYI